MPMFCTSKLWQSLAAISHFKTKVTITTLFPTRGDNMLLVIFCMSCNVPAELPFPYNYTTCL